MVTAWFSAQDSAELCLTAVTEAKIRADAAILAAGRRRDRLVAEVDAMVREDLAGRVLPFDSAAARARGAIPAARRSPGRPILEADYRIAAIARATEAAVATGKRADFRHCGIALIDPWRVGGALP